MALARNNPGAPGVWIKGAKKEKQIFFQPVRLTGKNSRNLTGRKYKLGKL